MLWKGCGRSAAASKEVLKSEDTLAMPHWRISEQVQGLVTKVTAGFEMTADVAPCTPSQSFARQKPQTHKTTDSSRSLPSLSLQIGSSGVEKESATDVLNQTAHVALANGMPKSQQFALRQSPARSVQFANSTPSKVLDRIQLEVHREGPELHKENLLSLSIPKQEKRLQVTPKLDPALALGQYTGQALPSRVFASLGVSKVSPTEICTSQQPHALQSAQGGIHNGSLFLPGSSHLQLQPAKPKTMASSVSLFSGYSNSPFDLGPTGSKEFSSEPKKSLTLNSSGFGEGSEMKWESQELNLELKAVPAFIDGRNLLKVHSEASPQWTANGACTTSYLPVKQDSNQTLAECVKYMQLLSGAPDFLSQGQQMANGKSALHVDSYDSGNPGKRRKSLSSTSGSASGSSQEQGQPNDLPRVKEARKPTRKKRPAVEQPKFTCSAVEVANASAQWYGQPIQNSQMHGNFLPDYVSKPKLCVKDTKHNNLVCLSQRESTENHSENVKTLHEEHAPSQLSPFVMKEQQPQCGSRLLSSLLISTSNSSSTAPDATRYFERVLSDAMDEVNAQSVGLKLSTTPAYAQMPKALSTFAAGEPSLPFSLEFSQRPPADAVAGKTPINVGASNDADWGKYLALSATPVGQKAEADVKTMLPFQQRFKKLQAFLKQCDESDQKDRLHGLRSLPAAARSSHAVELETRAIRLSLEEGKEMDRMKLLNVLGHIPDRNLYDAGATPQGPRLPAPGAASKIKQGS